MRRRKHKRIKVLASDNIKEANATLARPHIEDRYRNQDLVRPSKFKNNTFLFYYHPGNSLLTAYNSSVT